MLKKTWAVIDHRTRKALSMGGEAYARQYFAELKQQDPSFKGSVRQVAIPADHSDTGSFWNKKF